MGQLQSESIVVESPTSFTGSAKRLWRLTRTDSAALRWLLAIPSAMALIALAWILVAAYTLTFGVLLIPWRLIRRKGRTRKLDAARHREQLDAINREDV